MKFLDYVQHDRLTKQIIHLDGRQLVIMKRGLWSLKPTGYGVPYIPLPPPLLSQLFFSDVK